jgi:Ca2+-binding RTX toxin-like protein
MPGPSLGTNLSGVVDWSTSFPFVNQFLMTRPWFTQSGNQWDTGQAGLLDLDANGWIRDFTRTGGPAPFDRVSTIWNTSDGYQRDGQYVLEWTGAGTIVVNPGPGCSVVSTGDHRMVIAVAGSGQIGFSITSTDPAHTGDYLRDIKFYHQDDADLIDAGVMFNPDFLEKIQDFRVLRFMDWMNTNNSPVQDWAQMRPEDSAFQTNYGNDLRGVSVAVMVDLANQTHTDPWFTIPHLASDDYIRQFATYVRDHLDAGLVARFEYSNEVWNWGFQQAQWAQAQAQANWGSGVEGGWMQWYGRQAANMANIVADVFGSQTGIRALNVFSTQSGWPGLETYALNAPEVVADGGMAPRDAPFHVYAIAPYFGGSIGAVENAGLVNQWLHQGEAGYIAAINFIRNGTAQDSLAHIDEAIAYHARIAASLGWQLEAYEAGQHVVDLQGLFGGTQDPAQTQFFINLVKRPEFQALYTEYLNIWKDNGGGLMAQFSDFGPASRYGSWGIWDCVTSPDSPRAAAIEQFRDTVEAWWADGRSPGAFANGLVLRDGNAGCDMAGTALADALFGLGGDDLIRGQAGNDILYGGLGGDGLYGGAGSDTLHGGPGTDRLDGGADTDIYVVNSRNDVIVEGVGGGTQDRVETSVRYILAENVEVEWLTTTLTDGTDPINLIGNHFAQTIIGNAGANRLNDGGGAGADTLQGLGGNDVYCIGNAQTTIVENAGQGNLDRVMAGASFGLAADDDIELLTTNAATGWTAINLTGNALGQTIQGNQGSNRLDGMGGADVLTGGGGADFFVFSTAPGPAAIDRISDFQVGIDTIVLSRAIFSGLGAGPLATGAFWTSQSGLAADPGDRILYQADTGRLLYDSDGAGSGLAVQFAQLQPGLALTQTDFVIV